MVLGMPRALPLPVLLVLAACTGPVGSVGGDPVPEDCEVTPTDTGLPADCLCDDATLEVGGGALTFEPLAEGSPVTMVHGPQGGWHVLASARFTNLHAIVGIEYVITVAADGTVISDNFYRVQMVRDVECGGFYPGMYGYLDVRALATGDRDTPPELLADVPLVLSLTATDTEGRVATDTIDVVAALDPVDVPAEDSGGGGGDSGGR